MTHPSKNNLAPAEWDTTQPTTALLYCGFSFIHLIDINITEKSYFIKFVTLDMSQTHNHKTKTPDNKSWKMCMSSVMHPVDTCENLHV